MNIDTLITLLNNKVQSSYNRLNTAVLTGDIEDITKLEEEITETQTTIKDLELIHSIKQSLNQSNILE